MKNRWSLICAGAFLGTVSLFGCNGNGKTDTPAEQGAVNAANRTQNAANNAANNTANAADNAADKTANATQNAGNNAENAIKDAAKDMTAAMVVTPKVSGALKADKIVSAPGNVINVDSKDNIVHLKGTVHTNDIKARAGKIAQRVLTENHSTDQLSNELKVMKH